MSGWILGEIVAAVVFLGAVALALGAGPVVLRVPSWWPEAAAVTGLVALAVLIGWWW